MYIKTEVIGSCSVCGGPVVAPEMWGGAEYKGRCLNCGARQAKSYGPVIPMVPLKEELIWQKVAEKCGTKSEFTPEGV